MTLQLLVPGTLCLAHRSPTPFPTPFHPLPTPCYPQTQSFSHSVMEVNDGPIVGQNYRHSLPYAVSYVLMKCTLAVQYCVVYDTLIDAASLQAHTIKWEFFITLRIVL